MARGGIEVTYASSYFSKQNQVAVAILDRHDEQLRWHPRAPDLPSSWFWGTTSLSKVSDAYVPLTREIKNRCEALAGKASVEAVDLRLDP